MPRHTRRTDRRASLRAAAAASVAGVAARGVAFAGFHAGGSDEIRVGLIGCGGRGFGAAENVLHSAPNVVVVAAGDVFADRANGCREHLLKFAAEDDKVKRLGNRVDLPAERCFVGLDAYQKVIDAGVNYIILATPPGFRPPHLQAAIAAGKHVFTEKPVAVDGPGIRTVFAAEEESRAKGLAIAAGTQRRHQLGYLETIKRVHDGEIGEVRGANCYWNQSAIWFRDRKPGMSDLAYQLHNWYHFVWLSGDHIVEQHVHNIDVCSWALRAQAEKAVAMGGRVMPCREPQVDGHIFNFFSVDFTYPGGVHVNSMSRQVANCANSVSEFLSGSKGTCQVNEYTINGRPVVTRAADKAAANPYVQEHTDLIESIRSGYPINELKGVAQSTLAAIMGRMAAYTAREITWDQALRSQEQTMPPNLAWDVSLSAPQVAVPGQTKFT